MIVVLLILLKYVLSLLRKAIWSEIIHKTLIKKHCLVDVTKIIFLTESLMFGTVFLHALFRPPPSLNSFKHNMKSVDFSKFLPVEVHA